MRRLALFSLALGLAPLLAAQAPSRPDTTRTDSARRARLPDLEVRVTRSGEDRSRVPMAIGVLSGESVRRAQLTAGLDESLSRLPGVVVLNRYNYSLDQRVSLRGAGSRANFGLRGVKVLIDGVPQTLPDGQSQLTNLDLGIVDRVEVLTGSTGALYGNAAGGVLAFTTQVPDARFSALSRVTGGSFGTLKWQTSASGAGDHAGWLLSASRLTTDGFRQHSRAEAFQFVGKTDLVLSGGSTLGVRLSVADAPKAENPGALTAAEYARTRDSTPATNILRGADKSVTQQQLSLRYGWRNGSGAELDATVFGLHRDLENPLATPPPPPAPASAGTYNTIGRRAGGARLSGTVPFSSRAGAPRLSAGIDLQSMRDDRQNQRSDQGKPTGVFLADQRETVTEVGPFGQLHWAPISELLLVGAVRYDHLAFNVKDHLLSDGVDNSGRRVMENASGSLGLSHQHSRAVTIYANVSTSFESPTTTELVNTANGTVGFNSGLGPQRTVTGEIGVRGSIGGSLDYSVSGYVGRIHDAIIQAREQDGRAFFQNAGRVRTRGLEAGIGGSPLPWLALRGAYTYSGLTFSEYRIPNGATTDTLDGKRLAGVPRHFFRATATLTFGSLAIEADQTTASDVFADDRNTQRVEGWGVGVTSFRVSGTVSTQALRLQPFAAVNNAFDRRYVGSVNLNGAVGRILEPAPGRNAYVGMEVSWARR